MISKGKISKSAGRRNHLKLLNKEKTREVLSKDESDTIHPVKNNNHELYLYNQLREARKKAAEKFLQSGYLICPDSILREVARIHPKNKYELLNIKGFNHRMYNKLGNDFLEILTTHKSFDEKKEIITQTGLPSNIIETKKLVERKYTLKEIAETIKLSEAVISMQIETIVEFDPEIDLSSLIKKESLNLIIEEAQKHYDDLRELKERLPSRISYPEIRVALAKLKAHSQMQASDVQRKL